MNNLLKKSVEKGIFTVQRKMNDVRKFLSKTLIHSEDSPFQQIILSSNKFASHVKKKEASNLSLINLSTSLFLTLYLSTPYLVRMGVFRFASFIRDHELMIPGSKNSDPRLSRSLSLFFFFGGFLFSPKSATLKFALICRKFYYTTKQNFQGARNILCEAFRHAAIFFFYRLSDVRQSRISKSIVSVAFHV